MFKDHHYLDGNVNKASRCYIGVWEGNIVAFGATITMPSGTIKNAWRGHRTVILPDVQGVGIGSAFSNAIAQIHVDEGHRFFSKTSHPRLGFYRNNSNLWKPTSKNMKIRSDIKNGDNYKNHFYDNKRLCFSHEYIGLK